MKTLIMGIGNNLLGDDGAGLMLARQLYALIGSDDIDFIESSHAGSRCIDFLSGYDRVIIIEVFYDKDNPVGECYKIVLPEVIPLELLSSHHADFFRSLEVARQSGMVSLKKISIYAITAKEIFEFSQGLSQEMKERIPGIMEEIVRDEFMDDQEKMRYA